MHAFDINAYTAVVACKKPAHNRKTTADLTDFLRALLGHWCLGAASAGSARALVHKVVQNRAHAAIHGCRRIIVIVIVIELHLTATCTVTSTSCHHCCGRACR
jgi:hypothetical protein